LQVCSSSGPRPFIEKVDIAFSRIWKPRFYSPQLTLPLVSGTVVFSDEGSASMIEGIRHAKCEKHIFRHNDVADLDAKLKKFPKGTSKIIAFESVYSMDGHSSPAA
jgi:7-keto-8-aminopelargonate synthetase-like enzyme